MTIAAYQLVVRRSQHIDRATVRALRLAGFVDGQIHLRVRIPQVHAGHRAGQRQVSRTDRVAMLGVGGNQILVDGSGACSQSGGSLRIREAPRL